MFDIFKRIACKCKVKKKLTGGKNDKMICAWQIPLPISRLKTCARA